MSDLNIKPLKGSIDPQIRGAFQAIAAWAKKLKGEVDLASTTGGMSSADSGLIQSVADTINDLGLDDTRTPSAITDLQGTGLFNHISFSWTPQVGIALVRTDFYRSETDQYGDAVYVGSQPGQGGLWLDIPPDSSLSEQYWYWAIRVGANGKSGPPSACVNNPLSTADDPAYVMELLTGRITESQLYKSLSTWDDIISMQQQINALQGAIASAVYIQAEEPVPGVGGIPDPIQDTSRWYDSDDNNHPYIWFNDTWNDLLDPRIGQNASDIVALEASVSDIDDGLTANATAVDALEAIVVTGSNSNTALASRSTALEAELDSPATGSSTLATAFTSIQTKVSGIEEGADVTATATAFTTLSTTVGGHTTALQTKAEVSDMNAIWEVKTNVAGRVTGIGLVSGATETSFGVLADQFWIADPNDPTQVQPFPFMVDGPTVYINMAMIKDATITSAKIQSLVADKITAGTITAALTVIAPLIQNAAASPTATLDMSASSPYLRMTSGAGSAVLVSPGAMQFTRAGSPSPLFEFDGTSVILRDADGTTLLQSGGKLPLLRVDGVGALAGQDSVDYGSVSGTKPPSDADKTSSNTSYDTARVGGDAANQVVRASNPISSGNIGTYMGIAAIDTLFVRGGAITAPFFAGSNSTQSTTLRNSWVRTAAELNVNLGLPAQLDGLVPVTVLGWASLYVYGVTGLPGGRWGEVRILYNGDTVMTSKQFFNREKEYAMFGFTHIMGSGTRNYVIEMMMGGDPNVLYDKMYCYACGLQILGAKA